MDLLLNLWGYCSCLNLIFYIIYEDEYRKILIERFKKRNFSYVISEDEFYFWMVLVAFAVGIFGSVALLIQIMSHGTPFPRDIDGDK